MLTPEEKNVRDLQYAYDFQMRIATDKHNNREITHKAIERAEDLMLVAHRLRVNKAIARFYDN